MAKRLENGTGYHTEPSQDKAHADDPKRRNADFPHGIGSIEEIQQNSRHELEYRKSQKHDADGTQDAQTDGLCNPFRLSGTVIVCHDGYHSVIQSKHRHKDKALQFKIYSKHCRGSRSKAHQNLVHAKGHHRTDGCHDNGRKANAVNIFYHFFGKSVFHQ